MQNSHASNKIVLENALPGNPVSEWELSDSSGFDAIQGFTTTMSVNRGEVIYFKVKTNPLATNYHLDIYRLGYYNGDGARLVQTVTPFAALPQIQPEPLTDESTGLFDCGNWALSAAWDVPEDAASGIYIAKLVHGDIGCASHIVFVVRDDDTHSDLLFQTADTTWQAYNTCMGKSLYKGPQSLTNEALEDRAYKVSYNRPFDTRMKWPYSFLFWSEYPMLRWLEANGYDVSYFTGVDSDLRGHKILEHKVFLSVGHDEYWSAKQRANVEAARDAGIHLAFFSGNEVFWKIRWEDSIDGSGATHRTMVCYKETHANAKIDPTSEWTGTWRDPRYSPPADGGRPENALTGLLFTINGIAHSALTVPAIYSKMRLWRNTDIAGLTPGDTATFPVGTLGYEWGSDVDNGFRPPGLVHFSSTTATYHEPQLIVDYGTTFVPGTGTHHLALYKHASGALVFGASTVQWAWGLDAHHDTTRYADSHTIDLRMQQATVNLFADMDVQPQTLQPGLIASEKSTDMTAPLSVIASPLEKSIVQTGKPIMISGTASDIGSLVANVEVSVDGGMTWHPASGSTNWSYIWTPRVVGPITLKSRAVDDSGNLENPLKGVTITVELNTGPVGLWNDSVAPWIISYFDSGGAVELGVKFVSDRDGVVIGVRFYKAEGNIGTHFGRLWTSNGIKLGEVLFVNETAMGWQEAVFARPVKIAANTVYVVSYHEPHGHFAVNFNYFRTAWACPPLRAPADSPSDRNGVCKYGTGGFPTDSWQAPNYWVDVIFSGR